MRFGGSRKHNSLFVESQSEERSTQDIKKRYCLMGSKLNK